MNNKVFISLQLARVELQKMNLKKSGHNKFAGYKYFELSDILPTINELLVKHNLCSFVQFTQELATLTIISTEDGSQVQFTSPMSSANLKGCHDVQNLGAVQTYIRRYLYTNAFEIVESDALDSTHGRDDAPSKTTTQGRPTTPSKTTTQSRPTTQSGPKNNTRLSDAQVKRLIAIGANKGVSFDKIKACALRDYKTEHLQDLSRKHYEELCSRLEAIEVRKKEDLKDHNPNNECQNS